MPIGGRLPATPQTPKGSAEPPWAAPSTPLAKGHPWPPPPISAPIHLPASTTRRTTPRHGLPHQDSPTDRVDSGVHVHLSGLKTKFLRISCLDEHVSNEKKDCTLIMAMKPRAQSVPLPLWMTHAKTRSAQRWQTRELCSKPTGRCTDWGSILCTRVWEGAKSDVCKACVFGSTEQGPAPRHVLGRGPNDRALGAKHAQGRRQIAMHGSRALLRHPTRCVMQLDADLFYRTGLDEGLARQKAQQPQQNHTNHVSHFQALQAQKHVRSPFLERPIRSDGRSQLALRRCLSRRTRLRAPGRPNEPILEPGVPISE